MNDITFANIDSASVEASVLTAYEKIAGVTLFPGDPVRLFLESLAYLIGVQNNVIDLAGKQNLLAYAQGAHLDHLGYLMGVYRIMAQPATVTLRFSLGASLGFAVPIPKGTRAATADGSVLFETIAATEIKAGQISAEAKARALETGKKASGLLPGQIAVMVDPVPYVAKVTNTTTSGEGSDIEDDERLRERIRLAPESFTVAGSAGAYEARVLEVNAEISAVSVTTPEPGVVDVRFVLDGGELPDAALCALVNEHLSAETVRPLTDKVIVGAPELAPYALDGVWYLARKDATLLSSVTRNVAAAVEEYRLWQREQPGRDIVPDKLISLVERAGAKRVELKSPVFTPLEPIQIAREGSWKFAFGGVEDD